MFLMISPKCWEVRNYLLHLPRIKQFEFAGRIVKFVEAQMRERLYTLFRLSEKKIYGPKKDAIGRRTADRKLDFAARASRAFAIVATKAL